MFNGQNILPDFPEGLSKVVIFLKEKAAAGEFVFSDSFSEWENNEEVINSIGLGIDSDNFYYAVSLAYLAYLNKGCLTFPPKNVYLAVGMVIAVVGRGSGLEC